MTPPKGCGGGYHRSPCFAGERRLSGLAHLAQCHPAGRQQSRASSTGGLTPGPRSYPLRWTTSPRVQTACGRADSAPPQVPCSLQRKGSVRTGGKAQVCSPRGFLGLCLWMESPDSRSGHGAAGNPSTSHQRAVLWVSRPPSSSGFYTFQSRQIPSCTEPQGSHLENGET